MGRAGLRADYGTRVKIRQNPRSIFSKKRDRIRKSIDHRDQRLLAGGADLSADLIDEKHVLNCLGVDGIAAA